MNWIRALNRVKILLIAVLIGAPVVTSAQAKLPSCAELLQQLQKDLDPGVETSDYFNDTFSHPTTPTVQIAATFPGRFGGKRILIQRVDSKWVSVFAGHQYDYQGDPRWFIETIGREAAGFFGFKILSEREMIAPDSVEFRGALAKLNEYLNAQSDKVAVAFYTPPFADNVKVSEYTKKFADAGAIPMAPSGNHLIHDLSFHTAAIFLPANLVDLKRQTLQFLEQFSKFEEEKYRSSADKLKAVKYYFFLLRMHETISVDLATGILAPALISQLRKPRDKITAHDNPLITSCAQLSNEGRAPLEYFHYLLRSMLPGDWGFRYEFGRFADREKLFAFLSKLPLYTVQSDLEIFGAKRPIATKRWEDLVPVELSRRSEMVKSRWCKTITARRRELRDVILKILARRL